MMGIMKRFIGKSLGDFMKTKTYRIVNGSFLEDCFYCGKELEWAVDDYTFSYVILKNGTHKVMPFCWGCDREYQKIKNEQREKKLKVEQLMLEI